MQARLAIPSALLDASAAGVSGLVTGLVPGHCAIHGTPNLNILSCDTSHLFEWKLSFASWTNVGSLRCSKREMCICPIPRVSDMLAWLIFRPFRNSSGVARCSAWASSSAFLASMGLQPGLAQGSQHIINCNQSLHYHSSVTDNKLFRWSFYRLSTSRSADDKRPLPPDLSRPRPEWHPALDQTAAACLHRL